jgi:hypothetical protein
MPYIRDDAALDTVDSITDAYENIITLKRAVRIFLSSEGAEKKSLQLN